MRCPFCSASDTQVKDSRQRIDGKSVKRRRSCIECGSRFTTLEMIEPKDITIIKRDGNKRPFDRSKIIKSITIATRKREISEEQIELLVDDILNRLEKSGDNEIHSKMIGELIMQELQKLDEVSYVRFASVYKEFSEAKDFEKFLHTMNEKIKN
ncbi:MAG: transcriptional regulator NrdR [Alphaproteobacteria bacterium]|nr:transcriptional regulator NrdR [Alphaproteobacteria bacterium]